jgi:hypothetical protein
LNLGTREQTNLYRDYTTSTLGSLDWTLRERRDVLYNSKDIVLARDKQRQSLLCAELQYLLPEQPLERWKT